MSDLRRWRTAVFALFATNGFAVAAWASRTPAIEGGLHIGVAQMGALITGTPIGSIAAILLSSHVLHALGSRRTARLALGVMAGSLLLIGLGAGVFDSYPLTFVGFLVYGLSSSTESIVINVEAAEIDRRSTRTLMPLFHATFSIGLFVGSAAGALATLVAVPLIVHVGAAAMLIVASAVLAVGQLPALEPKLETARPASGFRARMRVWGEPRTLLIGVVVLGAAFTEGTANNWLALAMVEDRAASPATGAAYLAVFTASMTAGRLAGGTIVDRLGRVAALRGALVLAVTGLLLVVLVASPIGTIAGIVLWGLGASLGYPLGMSAAADNPVNAAARVSAVAAVGAIAFLIGPSIIGIIGQHATLLTAFGAVAVLIVASLLASSAARPPAAAREDVLTAGAATETQ